MTSKKLRRIFPVTTVGYCLLAGIFGSAVFNTRKIRQLARNYTHGKDSVLLSADDIESLALCLWYDNPKLRPVSLVKYATKKLLRQNGRDSKLRKGLASIVPQVAPLSEDNNSETMGESQLASELAGEDSGAKRAQDTRAESDDARMLRKAGDIVAIGRARLPRLTSQQWVDAKLDLPAELYEILQLVKSGLNQTEIAAKLELRQSTVSNKCKLIAEYFR